MNELLKNKLKEILDNKRTVTSLAKELGVSRHTVYKYLSRYKRLELNQGNFSKEKRINTAHNKIPSEVESLVITYAKRYPNDSVLVISKKLQKESHIVINPVTVFRILKRNNIRYSPSSEEIIKEKLIIKPPKKVVTKIKNIELIEKEKVVDTKNNLVSNAKLLWNLGHSRPRSWPRVNSGGNLGSDTGSQVKPGMTYSKMLARFEKFFPILKQYSSVIVVLVILFSLVHNENTSSLLSSKNLHSPTQGLTGISNLKLNNPSLEFPKGGILLVGKDLNVSSLNFPKLRVNFIRKTLVEFNNKVFTLATGSTWINTNISHFAILDTPFVTPIGQVLGASTQATSLNKKDISFIDKLSLNLFCKVGVLRQNVDISRCNTASKVIPSTITITNTPVITTVVSTTTQQITSSKPPVPSSTKNPKPSSNTPTYITEYITKYITLEGKQGPAGKDGISGKDGLNGKDSSQSQGGFGGYVTPVNNYFPPTPSASLIGVSTISYLRDTTLDYAKLNYGTSTNQYLQNATVNNGVFNGGNLFNDQVSFTGSVTINNLTSSTTNLTNATSTNHYITNLSALDSLFTNSTTTNSFVTNLAITNATTTNATTTNSFTTNATSTNHYITNLSALNSLFTNSTTTNATSTNLYSTSATLANATSTNFFSTNSFLTNGTSTNHYITNLSANDSQFTNATTTNSFLTNATSTNLYATSLNTLSATSTNLFSTNSFLTNGTSTNHYITNLVASDSLFTNSTTTNANITNLTNNVLTTNSLTATNGTTTNFFTTNLAVGTVNTSGNQTINGTLNVNGTTLIGSNTTIQGSVTLGTSTSNFITVNGLFNSNITPAANISYDLGTPSLYWRNVYAGTVTANSFSAASTSISGTNSTSFSINSSNASTDTQDSSLVFFRGIVTPNAILRWNSLTKRLESNMSLHIENETPTTGTTTFSVQGGQGQGAVNLFELRNNSGNILSAFDSTGGLSIGTTTTNLFKLQVAGNIGPDRDNFYDLGSSANRFANIYAVNFTSPSATFTSATSTNFFSTNATSTNLFVTNTFLTNATSTNHYITNLSANDSQFTSATSTNFFSTSAILTNASTTNLSAVGATLTSLFSTNATITNASTTNLSATGFTGTNGIFTGTFNVLGNTTLANVSLANASTTAISGTGLNFTNGFITNATLTNASTTNLSAVGATLASLFSTNATITNASTTNLSTTGFTGTNGIFTGTFNVNGQTTLSNVALTNASTTAISGTGLNFTNGFITNATLTNASTTNLSAVGATFTNTNTTGTATILNASTTNLSATGATLTNLYSTSATVGTLSATSASFTGAITGATSFNGLVITPNTGVVTTGTWNASQIANAYIATGLDVTKLTTGTTLPSNVLTSSLTTVGALASGSIASGFGTISTANTITGTTLNGTTGINTGATGGTQRIDASGNLVNIGTISSGAITSGLINGQTISSAANFTGTLNATGAITASQFNGSGAGLTGTAASLTTGVLQYLGNQTANTSGTLTGGLTLGGVYANGYPTSYGNVLNIGGGGYGQLLIGWSGTTGGTADNYIRSLRDAAVGTNNWSSWAKILTDQNYSGYSAFSGVVSGTTLNGTTGINTGASTGTQRIDASGNLVNIGTISSGAITSGLINGQTISSAANFTGTVTTAGLLQVNGGAGNYQLRLSEGSGTLYFDLGRESSDGSFRIQGNQTGANNIILAPTSGNVGIGATTPNAKLNIVDQNNALWSAYEYNDSDGVNMRNYRARGTLATPSAVLANDRLVAVLGGGYTSAGAFTSPMAGMNILAAENFTGTAQGTYLTFVNSASGTVTAQVERMRIDQNGNVGINTTAPTEKLDVNGMIRIAPTDQTGVLAFGNRTQGAGYYDNGIYRGGVGAVSAGNNLNVSSYEGIAFNSSAAAFGSQSTRMYIRGSDGNVGIGTTAPAAKLEVIGDGQYNNGGTGIRVSTSNGSTANTMWMGASSVDDASTIQSYKIGTGAGVKNLLLNPNGGNVGIGTTAPGAKLEVFDSTPTGAQAVNSKAKMLVNTNGNAFLEFRSTADNNSYQGLLFADNNQGAYVAFNNAGGGDDYLHIGGYNGVKLEYGAQDSATDIAIKTLGMTLNSTGGTFVGTVTGTTLNGTTGINTGAGAGTQRIDVSGNLVNIGTISSGAITSGLINGQTISSAANFTGTVGVAGTLTLSGAAPQISLANGTSNRIGFNSAGVAAPTLTSSSAGTKIILYPNVTASTVDFALGIESGTLWSSVPATSNQFKWYGATSQAMTLSGTGDLTLGSAGAGTLTSGLINGQTISSAANFTGSITAGGAIVASQAGFQSATYAAGRNRIWSFGNADNYGVSYFQGTGGYAGADSIGIHFGSATVAGSQFTFTNGGNFIATGSLNGASLNVGAGAITSGLINGQTISSAASFTGTVNAATNFGAPNYLVTPGNGNGVCFWNDCTNYKISMANTADYVYGPVTGYSIKTNMNGAAGWGWTWGTPGAAPIAAINNVGAMQIASTMTAGGNITSNGTGFYGAGGLAMQTNDAWLRLNQNSSFSQGLYIPGRGVDIVGVLRVNSSLEMGGAGSGGAGTTVIDASRNLTNIGMLLPSARYSDQVGGPSADFFRMTTASPRVVSMSGGSDGSLNIQSNYYLDASNNPQRGHDAINAAGTSFNYDGSIWHKTAGAGVGTISWTNNYALIDASQNLNVIGQGRFTGNVGIGVTSPGQSLSIAGVFNNVSVGGSNAGVEDRPGIRISGNYPEIVVMGGVVNPNHGATISLAGYDSGTSGTFKSWTMGTAGNNATFLDIGYGTSANPHINGIRGYGTTVLTLLNSGYVGFGDLTPDLKVDVLGYGKFGDADNDPSPYDNGLSIANAANTPTSLFLWQSGQSSGHLGFRSGDSNLYLVNSYSTGLITDTAAISLDTAGKVGIGTTAPGAKLEVASDGTAFTYPTPGTGKGSIHINPVAGTNDNTTSITFGANSNSTVSNVGQAGIYVQSSAGYGTKMYFGTTNNYTTGSQAKMMIDHLGNIGIGTTAPGAKLSVIGNGTGLAHIGNNGCGGNFAAITLGSTVDSGCNIYNFLGGDGSLYINRPAGGFIAFRSGNGDQVRIDPNGNVGIGIAAPAAKLHVYGAAASGGGTVQTLLVDGAGGNGAITINGVTGGHAYETLALSGVGKFEFGINPTGDFYLNPNIQSSSVGSAFYVQKSTGYVGIGTTGPSSKLTLYDDTAGDVSFLKLQHGTNYGANLGVNTNVTGDFFIQTVIAGTATKRLTIQRVDGSVGIGTASPGYPLDVVGTIQSSGQLISNGTTPGVTIRNSGGAADAKLWFDSSINGNQLIRYVANDANTAAAVYETVTRSGASITAIGFPSGNATFAGCVNYNGGTIGSCLSDERLKKNVANYTITGLKEIIGLNPVTYQYNGLANTPADDNIRTGLIAQQVQLVAPGLVQTVQQKLNETDATPTELLSVNYGALTFGLINAVKELNSNTNSGLLSASSSIVSLSSELSSNFAQASSSLLTLSSEFSSSFSSASSSISSLSNLITFNQNQASTTISSLFTLVNNNQIEVSSSTANIINLMNTNVTTLTTQISNITDRINLTNGKLNTLTLTSLGTVGIGNDGTSLGGELLRVSGRIRAQGFDIDNASDIAENFPASEAVDAGTVVAFSTTTIAWDAGGVSSEQYVVGSNATSSASSTASSTIQNLMSNVYQMSTVRKALNGYEAVGVISTNSGIVLGSNTPNGVPVAFSGRVPVKVTTENGEVKQGDYLTVSLTMPGYAMKLTGEGRSIGRALSDYEAGKDRVLMLVENGNQKLDLAGHNATTTGMLTLGNIDLNANGVSIINIKSIASANGSWSIDENGRIVGKSLTVDNVKTKEFCVDDVCVTRDQFFNMIQQTNSGTSTLSTTSSVTGIVAGTSTTGGAVGSEQLVVGSNTNTTNASTTVSAPSTSQSSASTTTDTTTTATTTDPVTPPTTTTDTTTATTIIDPTPTPVTAPIVDTTTAPVTDPTATPTDTTVTPTATTPAPAPDPTPVI